MPVWELFGETEFGARDVAALAAGSWGAFDSADEDDTSLAARVNRRHAPQRLEEMTADLRSLLESLRAKDAGSERSVGRVLQACVGRAATVETDEGSMPMAISSRPNRRAVMRYRLRAKDEVQGLKGLKSQLPVAQDSKHEFA